MVHNPNEISKERLYELLQSISKFMEKEIEMYALGGTALTIRGIKPSTLDIDININSKSEYDYVCKIFEQIGFERNGMRWKTQEGLVFDLFHGSNILGTCLLPDCLEKSTFIKSFGNIKLYALSAEDIIISKLARGDARDFDDIKSMLKSEKIDLRNLVSRYKETMDDSIVAQPKQKLLDLIEIKFRKWNLKIDKKLVNEVKKWE